MEELKNEHPPKIRRGLLKLMGECLMTPKDVQDVLSEDYNMVSDCEENVRLIIKFDGEIAARISPAFEDYAGACLWMRDDMQKHFEKP